MKTTREMPAFNGVAEGATTTLNFPIGWTYHGVLLALGGTDFTEQHITAMRLKGNGRPIMSMSGAQLDIMNQFDGLAASDGNLLYLPFERPNLLTRNGVEFTAIGTGMPQDLNAFVDGQPNPFFNPTPLSTLQLEVDINGSTAPTLTAKAVQSGKSPLGTMLKRRRYTFSPTGAGDFDIADLPTGDQINKIWIFSEQLNGVTLDRDNFRVFERTAAENNLLQADGVRVPQENLFVIDPTERGNGGEWLISTVDDFRLKLDMADGDTVTIFVDYLGGLLGN
jgi:hypothetical protein